MIKVAKYDDPHDACAAVVAESYRLWLQYETRTDDITIIVVHVNGLNQTADVENAYDAPLKSLPQVVEATGSESPFAITLNSKTNRFRHGLSRTQLKAIENSLDSAHTWVPPYASYRKTWEEEAHIERVLRDHFLFRRLTDSQNHVLLDCMQRMEVKPGDLVVEQGGEGECFYVVGNGEFEVVAAQEEGMEVVTKVLHRYTAENLSSFGELAFMYNKPLQASVRAVTPGTLWALRREDFRAILLSEFSNISSLKLLRSIEPFSRLTILQLSRISECLVEVSFSDGQKIIDKGESLSGLYVIRKGHVRLTFYIDTLSPGACCQFSCYLDKRTENQESHEHVVELTDGNHFGEWTLMGESVTSLSAVSVGDSLCSIITKEKFDSAVGSAPNHIKLQDSLGSSRDSVLCSDAITCKTITSSDLDWKMSIYATDCSEIGNVHLKGTDTIGCLKRFSRRKIKELGKKAQVLKEKELLLSLGGSIGVPLVICTFADQFYVGILFNCCLACPLSTVLSTPLDEYSAKFCAASLVVVLQELHKNSVLHRGICADVVMLDQTGHLQLVDFRFSKKLIDERTFTICGVANSLAPEIVLGKGHGFAADWWALGVLTYFMLQAEMPFGLGAENEAETSAKITSGILTLPQTFSTEAADFITKLLDANEITRLGSEGADSVKAHSWFNGINWTGVADGTLPVPREIGSRLEAFLQSRAVEVVEPALPTQEPCELSSPEWLEDW
ncbi:hypothetical protein HPP92_005273 [Vanilla planifolia]|uniref:cGMP-dependent protein kinase n=1 Tax=Vanilla planifolia TaxID=51239 RepID=A0A835VCG8_VANPL|nr:hypothetical protein HPP92_005273 [Vanilla planifolia]